MKDKLIILAKEPDYVEADIESEIVRIQRANVCFNAIQDLEKHIWVLSDEELNETSEMLLHLLVRARTEQRKQKQVQSDF